VAISANQFGKGSRPIMGLNPLISPPSLFRLFTVVNCLPNHKSEPNTQVANFVAASHATDIY